MQITKTGKLCCLILTLSIIIPMGVGFIMPSSVSQETNYTPGESSNITNDIRNATSDYYSDYFGDNNNSLWGLYPGLSNVKYLIVGETPTSTPIITADTNTGYFDDADQNTSMSTANADFDKYAYGMEYTGGITPGALIYTHTYTEDGQTVIDQEYGVYSAWWLRTQGKLIVDGEEIEIKASDTYAVSSSDLANTNFTIFEQDSSLYADITGGINLANGVSSYWYNGYQNSEVVFNMIIQPTCSVTIGNCIIERSLSGLVSMTYNLTAETIELGNYSNISLKINEEGITLSGLSAADLNVNPASRTITSILKEDWHWYTPFTRVLISSTNTVSGDNDLLQLYCYSAAIKVGSYASTVDKQLDMGGYWAGMKGYTIRFSNGTTIGLDASLTVAGYTFDLYPKTATIVYNGVSYNLTGTTITIVNDGVKFYGYLNSMNITEVLDQSQWTEVDLNGHWGSIGLSAARMVASNSDQFNWIAGTFNISVQEFAGIGLLTSALMFVAAAFIGRRSGMKVFWLMVTSGCIAAVYLVLFL